jgi:hypothetical protein
MTIDNHAFSKGLPVHRVQRCDLPPRLLMPTDSLARDCNHSRFCAPPDSALRLRTRLSKDADDYPSGGDAVAGLIGRLACREKYLRCVVDLSFSPAYSDASELPLA